MGFNTMGMDKAIQRGQVVEVLKLDILSGRACLSFICKYPTLEDESKKSRYWPYVCRMFNADSVGTGYVADVQQVQVAEEIIYQGVESRPDLVAAYYCECVLQESFQVNDQEDQGE